MSEETPQKYSENILSIIEKYGNSAYSVGTALGVNPNVIMGAVLEEYNDRYESFSDTAIQAAADLYSAIFNSNHDRISQNYEDVKNKSTEWRVAASKSEISKLLNPTLIDVGDGNIQIFTALDMLQKYIIDNENPDPMDLNYDPLGLMKYKDNYDELASDLNNPSSDATIKFAGLKVKEGLIWGGENVDNWEALSSSQKESFAIYYYNVGEDAANAKRDEAISDLGGNGLYEVDIDNTDIAQEYLLNEKTIDEKIREKIKDQEAVDQRCFAAGTQIDMADGTRQSIETIEVGDEVMAYDPEADAGRGELTPARVTRTMVNQVPHLLDFHGVKVTPGHATLVGEGPHKGKHIPLLDILITDGAVVDREGELLRAATNLPVGSEGDQFVEVAYITSKSQKTYFRGRMRTGTLTLDEKGNTHRVLDALKREGYRLLPDGLIAKDGETPHPLYWFGDLPKPADYVLRRSGLTLAELYSAEGRELEQPAPVSNSKIGANLGAVYAGMSVN